VKVFVETTIPSYLASTIHRLDALLSLNFRHLVNVSIQTRLRRLAMREGYELPAICTPEELMDINQ
jgi:hypothetical protein